MPASNKFRIEKAKIPDIPEMHRLINYFAQRDEMLARPLSELYENIRDFFVAREGGRVVACVALHVSWSDLAEIKALAVDERKQKSRIGSSLIGACLKEARQLGMPTVFCLTYKPEFFEKLGFGRVDMDQLPRKVWGECQRCAKFPHCDEVALTIALKPDDNVIASEPKQSHVLGQPGTAREDIYGSQAGTPVPPSRLRGSQAGTPVPPFSRQSGLSGQPTHKDDSHGPQAGTPVAPARRRHGS